MKNDFDKINFTYINLLGYFGKVGMRRFHNKQNPGFCPTINIENLWSLVDKKSREAVENGTAPAGQAPVVDCAQLGYYKVLGRGALPKIPIVVKARFFSSKAERRIRKVGGVCIPIA